MCVCVSHEQYWDAAFFLGKLPKKAIKVASPVDDPVNLLGVADDSVEDNPALDRKAAIVTRELGSPLTNLWLSGDGLAFLANPTYDLSGSQGPLLLDVAQDIVQVCLR